MKKVCVRFAILLGIAFASVSLHAIQKKKPVEDVRSLIARSQVWMQTDVSSMDLWAGAEGGGAFEPGAEIRCDYLDKKMTGMSPKFACVVPATNDELKVKYGDQNGEVFGEIIATRLLWALGFGADRMYSVKVVCHGCPEGVGGILQQDGDRVLNPAAVERKMAGRELADGWSWSELDRVDEPAGGAPRAHRDALKLLAVLIQHSDSKPRQQRLICTQGSMEDGHCATPLMMINDLGLTFGRSNTWNSQPRGSVNYEEWTKLPVWKNREGCVGNLSGSHSGTLRYPVIGEAGRQFLSDLLMKLSDQQIHDMFAAARVQLRPKTPDDGRSGFPEIDEWVAAFKHKRAEIAERHCGT